MAAVATAIAMPEPTKTAPMELIEASVPEELEVARPRGRRLPPLRCFAAQSNADGSGAQTLFAGTWGAATSLRSPRGRGEALM